jgi:type II secretory pathway pseudopilin PulG
VTLVELMFALAVIAIALVGIMSVITHTLSSKEAQKELSIAKETVASTLEAVRGRPFSEIGTYLTATYGPPSQTPPVQYTGPTSPQMAYYTYPVAGLWYSLPGPAPWTLVNGSTSPLGRSTLRVDRSNPNVWEIEATVQWQGTKGYGQYSMKCLCAK